MSTLLLKRYIMDSMMIDHSTFYKYIQEYVSKYPECGAHVSEYVAQGISIALSESQQRATDMEVIALTALSSRFTKQSMNIIKSKLLDWKGKTSFNWNSFLEDTTPKENK